MENIVKNVEIFKHLNQRELRTVSKALTSEHYQSGDVIIKQGAFSKKIYIITNGSVEVQVRLPGVRSKPIATLESGNFFGEVAAVANNEHTASIIANDNTNCLVLRSEYLQLFKITNPNIYYKVLAAIAKAVCARLDHIYNEIKQHETIHAVLTYDEIHFDDALETKPYTKKFLKKYKDHLYSCLLLKKLSDDDTQLLLNGSNVIYLPKYTCLYTHNDVCEGVYIVVRGALQHNLIYKGTITKLDIVGPGALVGQTSLFGIKTRKTLVVARENTLVIHVDNNNLSILKADHYHLWQHLLSHSVCSYLKRMIVANRQLSRIKTEV